MMYIKLWLLVYSVCRLVHDICIQEYMLCTVYGEKCRTAVFKNKCYVHCMQSSSGQLYSRIYVLYSVCRAEQDSCIQEYILSTVYTEQCRTAVFKNTWYVQCMQSSAGQLYSRIYVMYSVCRAVQDSCIKEYMICTVYAE